MPLPRLRRSRPAARVAIAIALGAVVCGGCSAKPATRSPRVPVTVAHVIQRELPVALSSTGTVEPLATAAVGSQVGGTVTRISFREGDEVGAGRVLIQIDPRPFRSALDQALASQARNRAQGESARRDAERAQQLFQQQVISQADWDMKRAAADAAMATLRADSATVAAARLNLSYTSIRAPIAGRTGQLTVHVGDYVKPQTSEPLVTINQVRPVRVRFTVPDAAVGLVQRYRGQRLVIEVRANEADSIATRGALVFVDNAVDAASGTLLLKGEMANRDGRLVPGQFVDVRLVLYVEPNAMVVPAPAVTTGQQGSYVYVLNADSTVSPRPVSVSRTVDEFAVIEHGLTPGETVVTDGQLRLSPGSRVVVRKRAASAS